MFEAAQPATDTRSSSIKEQALKVSLHGTGTREAEWAKATLELISRIEQDRQALKSMAEQLAWFVLYNYSGSSGKVTQDTVDAANQVLKQSSAPHSKHITASLLRKHA